MREGHDQGFLVFFCYDEHILHESRKLQKELREGPKIELKASFQYNEQIN